MECSSSIPLLPFWLWMISNAWRKSLMCLTKSLNKRCCYTFFYLVKWKIIILMNLNCRLSCAWCFCLNSAWTTSQLKSYLINLKKNLHNIKSKQAKLFFSLWLLFLKSNNIHTTNLMVFWRLVYILRNWLYGQNWSMFRRLFQIIDM